MTCFELKKIFSKPASKAALLLLAASVCVAAYFAIGRVEYVDENGEESTGAAAASALREKKNEWAGYVTEDVLRRALYENAKINDSEEYLSKDVAENNKAYSKKQGFSDIREMINCAYGGFQDYSYYRADAVAPEEAGSFYDRRIEGLAEWLYSKEQEDRYSERERQFLLARYEGLKTPLYYEYSDGWISLLEYAPTVIMLIAMFAGFLVAGIFSDEVQLGADSIFFSSKFGRDRAVAAKIRAGFLAITTIYWIAVALYSVAVLSVLGAGGAGCPIQSGFENFKSFYNVTYLQDYALTVFGGYLGNLFILFLAMLVSAKTRSKALAAAVPFIFLFLPSFLSDIPVLSKALGLLPDQLLQICGALRSFNIYQIGTMVAGSVPILFAIYLVLFYILLPVLYRTYRKTEVR